MTITELQFNVTGGDLYDEVLITADNKFFYNGNEVIVFEIENETTYTNNDMIQLRRGVEHYLQEDPSFGKKSDYTYYAGSYKSNNIKLGVNFKNATKSGFASVVTAVVFYLAGIAWQGVIPIFLTTFCADLLYQAQSSNPLGGTVSYSSTEYYHKDYKKFRINTFTSCKYIRGIGYAEPN